MPKSEVKASDLVSLIGGKLHGDPDLIIEKFTSFNNACSGDSVFVSDRVNTQEIYDSVASFLIIRQDQPEKQKIIDVRISRGMTTVVHLNPYLFFIRATE